MNFFYSFLIFSLLALSASAQDVDGEEALISPELSPSRLIWGDGQDCVRIIEYLDFECPFCKANHPDMLRLIEARGDDVCIYIKHLPVKSGHRYAFFLAAHYEAIRLQSLEAAVSFHNLALEEIDAPGGLAYLLSDQPAREQADRDFIAGFYQKLGTLEVDLERVQIDWASDDIRNLIEQDVYEAAELGANETPFFWIEGQIFRGQQGYEALDAIVSEKANGASENE